MADFDVDDFPGGLAACLEAVLIAADRPLQAQDLARMLGVESDRVMHALESLQADYDGDDDGAASACPVRAPRGFELRRTVRGWRFASRAVFDPVVRAFTADGQSARLSQAALETLAIVAYQQPVTRSRLTAIRGVNSDGVVRSLLLRGLVCERGEDEETGAALLITSDLFLEYMGLDDLDQLPSLAPFLPESADDVTGSAPDV
ncbi:SMC-Scp complex subunit ScpB [Bifidobacterium margollesii]|uniref:SMC-Scp complex subunit ScpB n=1 Tax=Bifidobacterium margollesii TaxID=2020964 RepID=A0A2N5J8H9_9BIFI|nr:SMC-Scp complex subunit ScpB [Bifidobacterium margollesii]PLS30523.1 SMC-Scp complex subunit ScpB [Bifidobacterium margollesii]